MLYVKASLVQEAPTLKDISLKHCLSNASCLVCQGEVKIEEEKLHIWKGEDYHPANSAQWLCSSLGSKVWMGQNTSTILFPISPEPKQ